MTPSSVELLDGQLRLAWSDGIREDEAVTLRAACRCADCRAAERNGLPCSLRSDVLVERVVPVGAYALQLRFSDGHDRGIYPFRYLRELPPRS